MTTHADRKEAALGKKRKRNKKVKKKAETLSSVPLTRLNVSLLCRESIETGAATFSEILHQNDWFSFMI